jgi:hypothetical protein
MPTKISLNACTKKKNFILCNLNQLAVQGRIKKSLQVDGGERDGEKRKKERKTESYFQSLRFALLW